ncbi:MAG: DUF167 domain-containing protein [Chlorobiaceae bacterium]|nr:DUF167 domain-containing protein [Chlorobiaceae bacterium]
MAVLTQKQDGVCISIRVQPRSSRSGVAGLYGESVRICLKSAPVDDAANLECSTLLSRLFGVPRSSVSLVSGRSSRSKVMRIEGLSVAAAEAVLAPYLASTIPHMP